jgi:hypothetical protein
MLHHNIDVSEGERALTELSIIGCFIPTFKLYWVFHPHIKAPDRIAFISWSPFIRKSPHGHLMWRFGVHHFASG